MDNRIIYISYATLNTPYLEVIKKFLLPSLEKFNLSYDIVYPENQHSWTKNTHLKATIIKEMLLKHKQPIVFLDADATIESYPELFDKLSDYDIGAHYLDYNFFWKGKTGNLKRSLLSGTLYINYNERVLTLVDKWIEENSKNTGWEQQNLQNVIEKDKDLKVYNLPIQYTAIVKKNGKVPDYIEKPIIIHWQKSREYRTKIK